MRLRSLELVGFKTFAEPTELVFGEGVTAIIGPNGSGKSNCADALLWVLAERRLSALRASEGTDVIFAGSERRKPLGLAEVSLLIDNEDGALGLDLREVAVTRRVHRTGENDYFINHRRCRRKDVIDLFLDTGVGRQSFSVISQREVDAILSIDPADRRRLLEEVAGIERYRTRRDETLRRLDDTAANLTRLGDVTLGLELQLDPLAEQRLAAEAYLALKRRADQLRLSLLAKDYQLAERRVLRVDEELARDRQAIAAAETGLRQAEAAEQTARLELLRADERLAAAREGLGEAARATDRLQNRLDLLTERRRNLATRLSDAEGDLARQAELAARLATELDTETRAAETAAAELAEARAARRELLAAAEVRRRDDDGAEAELAEARRRLAELTARQAGLESRRQAALAAVDQTRERRESALERHRQAEIRLAAARDELAATETAVEAAQAALAALLDEQRRSETAAREAQRAWQAARDRLGEAQVNLGERQARRRVLAEADAAGEGLFRGVKAVLEARDKGRLTGRYEVVADALRVAEGCEVAIEAALGPRLQDLICDDRDDARAAIDFLKQTRGGRATFLPLEDLRLPAPLPGLARLRTLPGVVGHGLDLVGGAPDIEDARRFLLTEIIVVETVDAGLAVRDAGWAQALIVTLDGDLLRPSGVLSGGSREQTGPHLLQRKRELEQMSREVAALEADRATLAAEVERLTAARQADSIAIEALAQQVTTARRGLADAERARLEARGRVQQATVELDRRAEELTALDAAAAQAATEQATAEAELATVTTQRTAVATEVAAAETRTAGRRTERRAEDEALAAARERVTRLEARVQALADATRRLTAQQTRVAEETARLERAQEVWRRESEEAAAELARLTEELAAGQAAAARQREQAREIEAGRAAAMGEVEAAVAAAREARQDLADSREQLHRAELRRTTAAAELTHLRQTLAEEYRGLTPAEALARADEIGQRQAAAEELEQLRSELEAMGEVNLGSIEEYDRITEQLRFYTRQREDLEAARSDLLAVIAEIDDLSKVRLATAFEAVQGEFLNLFRRIFGDDGEATLAWTRPDDILDSGVEVNVRMPGKRAQDILLLSGGERAMCSICLLFAMFRVKPSPFCLLDELDASLDEANIRKYVALLREFARTSQFIVITHNPETTRAADLLYGITMPEPGVSRAYSHRPPADEAEGDETSVAAD